MNKQMGKRNKGDSQIARDPLLYPWGVWLLQELGQVPRALNSKAGSLK